KMAVAVLALLLLPYLVRLLGHTAGALPRMVANAHTGFNLLKLALVLPAVGWLSQFTRWLVPERPSEADDPTRPRYLGAGALDGNSLALSQSMREILRVAEIVRGMCDDVWRALRYDDERLARQVSGRDDQVDRLEAEIKRFLA